MRGPGRHQKQRAPLIALVKADVMTIPQSVRRIHLAYGSPTYHSSRP